jgi:hypothetical protein
MLVLAIFLLGVGVMRVCGVLGVLLGSLRKCWFVGAKGGRLLLNDET